MVATALPRFYDELSEVKARVDVVLPLTDDRLVRHMVHSSVTQSQIHRRMAAIRPINGSGTLTCPHFLYQSLRESVIEDRG